MDKTKLELFWSEIPVGKENAIEYPDLCFLWNKKERDVRAILHELSLYDNGDDYILIRSASGKGFYRTDDPETIKAYRTECLNKGKSVFAPVKKINRVLQVNKTQFTLENNMRVIRESRGLKQSDVCKLMRPLDRGIDKSMLSRMENSVCMPTPYQLAVLSEIYGCTPSELVDVSVYISSY